MKFVFTRVIAAITLLSLLVGCSDSSSFRADPEGRIKVLAPAPQPDGKYKLQVFELLGIEDLKKLSGHFAQFFFSPKVVNSKLVGESPSAQFIRNSSGVYVPTNAMTQQMSVIYYHLQQLAVLDAEFGVASLNHWPRSVGMGVNVSDGIENNAFYDGATDAMLFVPYSNDDLSIALNGGIIAHEHFHSLFYKFVMKENELKKAEPHNRREFLDAAGILDETLQDKEISNSKANRRASLSKEAEARYYREVVLRALNEGLADYWGWMYTGDPDFIVPSLKEAAKGRTLEPRNVNVARPLPRVDDIVFYLNSQRVRSSDSDFDKNLLALSYFLGTSYARFFKNFADVYGKARDIEPLQARKEIAKKIIQILPLFKESFNAVKSTDHYDSLNLIELILETTPDLQKSECEALLPALNYLKSTFGQDYVCTEENGLNRPELEKPVPVASPEPVQEEVNP